MQQDLFSIPAEQATKKPKGLAKRRHALLSDFEACLADRAADHDLSAAIVHYARELVSLENALSRDERRALLLLVLASIVEQRNGSTRLPLDAGEESHLRELIRELLPARNRPARKADDTVSDTMLETLQNLLEQGIASTVIGGPDDYCPLIVDDGHLYHQRMLHYETRLVAAVRERMALGNADLELDAVRQALGDTLAAMPLVGDGVPMQLNAEQQYALLTAVYRPLTIISGGPGTGKTSIVVSLMRMLVRLGIAPDEIALAAPTGKAANRLGESINAQLMALDGRDAPEQALFAELDEPRTLHRLLGYSQARNGFYYHENNRLRQRVIIVDEASMIDLFLMERLISAVDPGARLILLGDAEQLPSVDSGAVFRDLVPWQVDTRTPWRELVESTSSPSLDETTSDEPTAGFAVRLETSYRMDPNDPAGANILRAAQALNRGEVAPLFSGGSTGDSTEDSPLVDRRTGFDEMLREGVELIEPAEDAPAPDPVLMNGFVDWWYAKLIGSLTNFRERILQTFEYDGTEFSADATAELRALFEHFAEFRVLAITRVFATGSERLNAAFHARHLRLLGRTNAGDLEVGEPIIMLQNDYGRGLFNGDQGLVLDVVRTDGDFRRVQQMAIFERDGEFVPFNIQPIRRHIEHAFALTVHKAQGSEFDTVAVVLPTEDIPLLTREILYTGMTRSKRSVVLVGEQARIEAAANNPVRRFSGVAQKLGSSR
ncbi:exodeoxyribonuclease V subunit alpha [Persicimonas caeni]|uniref:Exodeoxyribonuclease V subunit alpha n=1 Tax=Persicimonas caeni TaxID=2292766 RepID=A0A4Y6PTV5_PERCE|nr:exodeoxyribonuclease V subunit alpha [Persicimonas caeni]QDG51752.1 exodeoxyribonuclease V subunit alpha [Persicimonas caeni]QED32973.1 exodeoxyribonuclease V subunit alpha [Persicimonas caeni]